MSQLAMTDLQSPAEKRGEGQARGDLSAEVGRERHRFQVKSVCSSEHSQGVEGSRDWLSYRKSTCTPAGQPASILGLHSGELMLRPHQSRVGRERRCHLSLAYGSGFSHHRAPQREFIQTPSRTTSGEQRKDQGKHGSHLGTPSTSMGQDGYIQLMKEQMGNSSLPLIRGMAEGPRGESGG